MSDDQSIHSDISYQGHSELVIGLIGAVGTELKRIFDLLEKQLITAGYNVYYVSVSGDVIENIVEVDYDQDKEFDRINSLMSAGNTIREKAADASILAYGVAAKINEIRLSENNNKSLPLTRSAFIISSLKRPEEIQKLREIYHGGFVLLGVYSDENRRINELKNRGISEGNAIELVNRDSNEHTQEFGQRLTKSFFLSDFFVRINGSDDWLQNDLKRIIELLFGSPYKTPNFDEYAMFFAFAAALRSADLSRQVGAVITKENQILATGANDCPEAGGGLYWPERNECGEFVDFKKGRDYTLGLDSNKNEQRIMIDKLCSLAIENEIDPNKLRELLESRESPLGDLTEYGRVVHAEMDALTACARNNISTNGAVLYCTTFPCHNCAKHIVAAGIKRVVYVEPYEKSKAKDFHQDSIAFGFTSNNDKRVKFEPFVGIGPRQFFDLFSMNLSSGYDITRKDRGSGKTVSWDIRTNDLRLKLLPSTYLDFELEASNMFNDFVKKFS